MTPEQQQLLAKSKDSLKAARLLLENNLPAFATARAYYTMFYIAEAMLLKKGLVYSSHAAVIAAFGREFAQTKIIPIEYHRYLIDGQEKRTEADYSLNPNISLEQTQEFIDKATDMLDFAKKNIDLI